MKKVTLYIAFSLDGYIADKHGAVDWIKGQDESQELEDTFTPFFNGIDTVIMGRNTYDQIVTELSPEQWPYEGATTYVLTHRQDRHDTDNIRFRNTNVCRLVEELKQEEGKNIWICGGAKIAGKLIAHNMIDTYHLAIIPVILGNGIRLFDRSAPTIDLSLSRTREYNGIIELIYNKR